MSFFEKNTIMSFVFLFHYYIYFFHSLFYKNFAFSHCLACCKIVVLYVAFESKIVSWLMIQDFISAVI